LLNDNNTAIAAASSFCLRLSEPDFSTSAYTTDETSFNEYLLDGVTQATI